GEYRGLDPFEFLDPDGGWHDSWVPARWGRPEGCRTFAHRVGWAKTEGLVITDEIAAWETVTLPGTDSPHRRLTERWEIAKDGVRGSLITMLTKCTEAAALRRTFPAELDGFYVEEEMARLRKERRDTRVAETRAEGEAKRAAAYAAANPPPEREPVVEDGVHEGVVVEHQHEPVMDS